MLEIEFLDRTHLAIGSSSSVTLDTFVYAGGEADTIVIGLTKGAFRFATGVASKKAYKIKTPIAGIGVRGTRFSALIGDGVLRVTLEEGGVDICPNGGGRCIALDRPNETVEVRAGSAPVRLTQAYLPSLLCSRASGSANLCVPFGSGGTGPTNPQGGSGNGGTSTPASGNNGQGRGGKR